MIAEEFAPAKVNLWLRVTGRRADGYHELDSLVVFAGVGDVLRAEPAAALTLEIDGPFAGALAGEADNLVLRAARAVAPGVGARLVLTKNLPVAAGLGGGSADAAAAIRVMARLAAASAPSPHPDPPPRGGREQARALGADVTVCLEGRPCRMRGAGEILDPAPPLPAFGLLLANPGVALETRRVFAARNGPFSEQFEPRAWASAAELAADIETAGNDLTEAAVSLCPLVAEMLAALRALPGALAAQMSGSGATCFALFPSASAAIAARPVLPPCWWSWVG